MAGHSRRAADGSANARRSSKTGIIAITVVVGIFAVVIWTRIESVNDKLKSLNAQAEELEADYHEQEKRALELEERKAYTQTKKYVEEVAKQLGLVYPDEIIYKPSK